MRKALRKLLPTILMLIVSAVLVGTSTFAWFSMNKSVSVTGMQITAKSNNTFLLIGTGEKDTAEEIQGDGLVTIDLNIDDSHAYVYPSKPIEASEIGSGSIFSSATAWDTANADDPERWYTAASRDPHASTTNSSGSTVFNATVLSSGNFTDYVIHKIIYMTLAKGSDNADSLNVTLKTFVDGLPVVPSDALTPYDNSAVRILIVTEDNYVTLSGTDLNTPKSLHDVTNQVFTDADVIQVDIYLYYDGSADAVYTSNVAHLIGAKFDLEFDVEIV